MNLFEEIQNKKAELDRLISDYGKQALQQLFNEFFEANPTIEAIRWVQYIPGFNDGDPCTFTLHEAMALIPSREWVDEYNRGEMELDEAFGEECHPWYDEYTLTDYSQIPAGAKWEERDRLKVVAPEGIALRELNKTLQSNPDTIEVVFSSYADVTATREGFLVQEYDAPY